MADRDALSQFFQQYLGRPATEQELKYIGDFIDQGHLNTYEAGNLISGLPEAQQRSFSNYGQQYQQALGASDEAILGKAGKQLQSRFAQQGRPDTSSYGAAYMSAARDLAISRQPAIAQFYGQGYRTLQEQPYMASQRSIGRAGELQDAYRNRAWEQDDYTRQQNDYNDRLNSYNRTGRWDSFLNSGIQAGAGIYGSYVGKTGRFNPFGK